MDLELRGRVAVVTGSSRGIGKAAALLFAREGARVAVTYHEHRTAADEVVAAARAAGTDAIAVQLELGADNSIRGAIDTVLARWQRVDVLVNNAVMWGAPPWTSPPFEHVAGEQWRPVFRANAEGAYAAIQAVVPSMRARKWGRILNISSGVAVDGLPGAAPYAMAKAALHGLTRTLYKELGPDGILVNTVMAGLTLTERNRAVIPEHMREHVARNSPVRRLLAPDDVAPMIVFLCSALNTATTGEIIRSSGGIT